MTVYIGADHRGFKLKNQLVQWLNHQSGLSLRVVDQGAYEFDPADDYPDFAFAVGEAVAKNPGSLGVVICGSSIGVTIAANKVKGVRAASVCTLDELVHGRERDGLNVLALAADRMNLAEAKELIEAFIQTKPLNKERFLRRLKKIATYEKRP